MPDIVFVTQDDMRDAALAARRLKADYPAIVRTIARVGPLTIVRRHKLIDGEIDLVIRVNGADRLTFHLSTDNLE